MCKGRLSHWNESGKVVGPIVLEVDEHQNVDNSVEEEFIRMIQVSKFIQIQQQGAQNILDPIPCE